MKQKKPLRVAGRRQNDQKHQQQEVTLTWEEWVAQFRPIRNPFIHDNRDEYAFETFGKEHELVKLMQKKQPRCVWTLIDYDGGSCISEGYHHVDRQLYYLTNIPAAEGVSYTIDEHKE